jgi:DNA-binding response OmpR family regulator
MYNILICDDQPDIVNALKIYLAPEGYNLLRHLPARRPWKLSGITIFI